MKKKKKEEERREGEEVYIVLGGFRLRRLFA
jgi:hypothetical protein